MYYAEVDFKKHLCDIKNHIRYKLNFARSNKREIKNPLEFIKRV